MSECSRGLGCRGVNPPPALLRPDSRGLEWRPIPNRLRTGNRTLRGEAVVVVTVVVATAVDSSSDVLIAEPYNIIQKSKQTHKHYLLTLLLLFTFFIVVIGTDKEFGLGKW